MNGRTIIVAGCFLAVAGPLPVKGQTSSLGAKARSRRAARVQQVSSREAPRIQRNRVYDQYSWITAKPEPPKTFRVGDLITIIVRETRQFESDAELRTRKKLNLTSELQAFLRLTSGGVGATAFQRGQPNIDYRLNSDLRNTVDADREDRLTMRITGSIIDVKPNGTLVIEARGRVQHDEEISRLTLTGTCRKNDVTADNTILSTQLADKNVSIINGGAVRSGSSRGWLMRLIDNFGPF